MKKSIVSLLICIITALLFSGCAPSLSSIDVEQKDVTLNKGDTLLLEGGKTYRAESVTEDQAAKAIEAAAITWTSSDEAVVTVDNGMLTAIGAGTAEVTVTAQCGKETVSVPISVTVVIPLEDIAVTPDTLELTINGDEGEDTASLAVELLPADATDPPQITYTSSDEAVVTVDESGQVTAVGDGEAEITVKCGEIEKTVAVTVTTKRAAYTGSYSSGGGSSTGSGGSGGSSSGGGSGSGATVGSSTSTGNPGGNSWEIYIPDEDFETVDYGNFCGHCGSRWDDINNTCPYCDGTVSAPLP